METAARTEAEKTLEKQVTQPQWRQRTRPKRKKKTGQETKELA